MHEHQHEGNGRTPSPESLERRHEQADLNAKSIATFLAILTFVVGSVGLAMVGLFYLLSSWEARREPPASPLAMSGAQLPPEPRLQALPSVDLAEMREENAMALNTYGWVSREAGVVRVPIKEAMGLVAQRGLPLWPITPPEQFEPGPSNETPPTAEPAPAAPSAAPVTQTPGLAPGVPPILPGETAVPPAEAPPAPQGGVQ